MDTNNFNIINVKQDRGTQFRTTRITTQFGSVRIQRTQNTQSVGFVFTKAPIPVQKEQQSNKKKCIAIQKKKPSKNEIRRQHMVISIG